MHGSQTTWICICFQDFAQMASRIAKILSGFAKVLMPYNRSRSAPATAEEPILRPLCLFAAKI
jgi:hypothetical protein